jgi:hypothetical protein
LSRNGVRGRHVEEGDGAKRLVDVMPSSSPKVEKPAAGMPAKVLSLASDGPLPSRRRMQS